MRKVRDILVSPLQTVEPSSPVQQAVRLMKTFDIGWLPVCDGGRVQGVLTDRDIALRVVAEGRDPAATAVAAVMTQPAVCVTEADSVRTACRRLRLHRIRRLAVVDADLRLVGMVSLGRLTAEEAEDVMADVLSDQRGFSGTISG